MNESIWATWYDLEDAGRDAWVEWLHADYLPWLRARDGIAWVAHYRNAGTGPALARYHDIAGHAPEGEGLGTGSQYVLLAGASGSHAFYRPNVFDPRGVPQTLAAPLARRLGLRSAILVEEARVDGPAVLARAPGACPASAIQFGTYRIRSVEEELDINLWYAHQRFPLMARMPGSVLTRKFVSSTGWAKHGILYEFESLQARTRHFEEPEEAKVVDPAEWTGRIVRTTLHTPGSPFVGERLWPPQESR